MSTLCCFYGLQTGHWFDACLSSIILLDHKSWHTTLSQKGWHVCREINHLGDCVAVCLQCSHSRLEALWTAAEWPSPQMSCGTLINSEEANFKSATVKCRPCLVNANVLNCLRSVGFEKQSSPIKAEVFTLSSLLYYIFIMCCCPLFSRHCNHCIADADTVLRDVGSTQLRDWFKAACFRRESFTDTYKHLVHSVAFWHWDPFSALRRSM